MVINILHGKSLYNKIMLFIATFYYILSFSGDIVQYRKDRQIAGKAKDLSVLIKSVKNNFI